MAAPPRAPDREFTHYVKQETSDASRDGASERDSQYA